MGMFGSLALIFAGAVIIMRQTPSDALFTRHPGSMIEARAFLSGVLVLAGVIGFFITLNELVYG